MIIFIIIICNFIHREYRFYIACLTNEKLENGVMWWKAVQQQQQGQQSNILHFYGERRYGEKWNHGYNGGIWAIEGD